jgi:Domain of unknown function (DUF4389)
MEAQLPPPPSPPSLPSGYPVTFSVDYPDRELDRLTTAFRIFTVIPIGIVLSLLTGQYYYYSTGVAVVFLPTVLMLVFRQKYPRWWFDWNLEVLRFSNRVFAYLALMDDRYPSTEDQQSVRLDFPYPEAVSLNRWLPLVKWFLAIPHYFVLFFLYLAAFFAGIGAWFAILFTGRYPRGIFNFIEGVIRWGNRVTGYAFTLITDQYPPFRLSP